MYDYILYNTFCFVGKEVPDFGNCQSMSSFLKRALRLEGPQLTQRTITIKKNVRESLGMRIGGGIGSNEGDTPIYVANIHPHGCIGKSKQLKVLTFKCAQMSVALCYYLINQWALSNNLITLLGFWNESAVICSRYTWMGLCYKLYWYKDHEREFVFGKNDFENAFLLLDTFFIEAYFCIIYNTGYNTTWPKAIHFHALYRVSVSINQWIRRLLLLWIIHMWIWENSLKANSFPFSESSCVCLCLN